MNKNLPFFILTGGPSSGKTTLLNELTCRGFFSVPEVARAIIQEQVTSGGNAIHTGDRCKFRDLMLEHSIADYKRMQKKEGIVFF